MMTLRTRFSWLIRNCPFPRTTVGPYVKAYCRVLGQAVSYARGTPAQGLLVRASRDGDVADALLDAGEGGGVSSDSQA